MNDDSHIYELWYTRHHGIVRGPFPARVISNHLLLGRLLDHDDISLDRQAWVTIAQVPRLIPQEMRAVATEEDGERLRRARLRADERMRDRRAGRKVTAAVMELRRGQRRRAEDREMLQQRTRRVRTRNTLLVPIEVPNRRAALAIGGALLAGLIGAAAWYGSDFDLASARDCATAPAPRVDWNHCDRSGASLAHAELRGAVLNNARLTGADLRGADLTAADLSFAELRDARLDHAQLAGADLRGAVLRGAQLRAGDLSNVDLRYADLRGAGLAGAKLDGAQLAKAVWVDGRVCGESARAVCD